MSHRRIVIAVVNLKGGTGKTTSAMFGAHVLAELGRSVYLLDGDKQGSALSWQEDAPERLPFPVVGLPSNRLHVQLADVVPPRCDAVVIDTPPLEESSGVVVSALRVADAVLVPMKPTPTEYKRVRRVREVVDDAAGFRASGEAVPLFVVLYRTKPNASSTAVWADQLRADGIHVLQHSIPDMERYAQADGDNISHAAATHYGDVFIELLEEIKA
jgi:chromosome partitioning protein